MGTVVGNVLRVITLYPLMKDHISLKMLQGFSSGVFAVNFEQI